MYSVPADLRYTADHEWARLEGGGVIRVGITDFAQQALGDIVYLELPAAGTPVQARQPMGEVESPKAVSDIFCPISGSCVESNPACRENPELVNQDPYGEGWLIVVEPSDPNEYESLMSPAEYQALIEAGEEAQ